MNDQAKELLKTTGFSEGHKLSTIRRAGRIASGSEKPPRSIKGEIAGFLVWGTIISLVAIGALRAGPYIGQVIKAVEIQVQKDHGLFYKGDLFDPDNRYTRELADDLSKLGEPLGKHLETPLDH